jgi:hypothetical protein
MVDNRVNAKTPTSVKSSKNSKKNQITPDYGLGKKLHQRQSQ